MKKHFIIMFLVACMGCAPEESRDVKLSKWLDKNCPTGTEIDTVKKLLAREGLEFSWVESEKTIYGVERKPTSGSLASEAIAFKVFFDTNGHVTKTEVKKVFTGP
jgi:hypothetical protein